MASTEVEVCQMIYSLALVVAVATIFFLITRLPLDVRYMMYSLLGLLRMSPV